MTRPADLAPPTLAPPPHPPTSDMARRLHVALERLPVAAYTWDDTDAAVVWDAPGDAYVWDAPFVGGGFTDAVCDTIACTVTAGHPDELGLVAAAEAVVTLANPDGEYSTLDASGRLVYWAIGRRVHLFGDADGEPWWLFSGRVTGWDQNPDGTVTVTAHDGFAQLAPDPAQMWTPGAAAQTAAQRIAAILATWEYPDPVSLETTDVRMAAPPTERSPLAEAQVTALSDGGFLFCDADGRLWYRGRTFNAGRTDQTVVRGFTDNMCDAGVTTVWDFAQLTDDDALASRVLLENTAGLTATATAAPNPWAVPYTFTHPDPDLWTEQTDGNRLAADLLARHGSDAARFSFALYLRDPHQDLWRTGLDLRLGDRVNVLRTYPAAGGGQWELDVDCLVVTISHDISPDSWVTTVETGRVVTYRVPQQWDRTPYTWDDPNPANVWSR